MTEQEPGSDRLGRRARRFLTPLQKDEIWLQLVRGETTIAEAADRYGVDRSTVMRLGTVAKDGALQALADSKPGGQQAKRDLELEAARAEAARLGEAVRELAVKLVLVEGKGRWAEWPGPAPGRSGHQVGAAGPARAGLWAGLDGAGRRSGARGQRAAHRPVEGRRAAGELADQAPAGSPMHGLGDWEVAEIVRRFGEGGEVDPLPPQARPPRLVPGAGVGLAGQPGSRAGG
jgi:transposase